FATPARPGEGEAASSKQGQQKETHRGGGPRGPPEPRRTSRSGGHVLLALNRVGDDAASDGTARVESVKNLAALRVEYQEIACQFASENQVRRCRRHGGNQGPLRLISPGHRPRRCIYGREP